MGQPRSFRLPPELIERIAEGAAEYGTTATALVTSILDEGIKMRQFPYITYHPGASGRRAVLAGGPDVWEVVRAVQELDGSEDERIATLVEEGAVTEAKIRQALAFYAAYPDEIDARVGLDEAALREHETEEQRLQRLYAR